MDERMREIVSRIKQAILDKRFTKEQATYWTWTVFVLKESPWGEAHEAVLESLKQMEPVTVTG